MIQPLVRSFAGIEIHVVPDYYMTLSEDVPVTPEFRAEINAWMRSFFKPKNIVPDGEVYRVKSPFTGKPIVTMNPRTYESFKASLPAANHDHRQ